MLHVDFSMFIDRKHVANRLSVYQKKVLGGTGSYGRRTMKNLFRPPKAGKKSRTVVVGGRPVIVPIRGKVIDAQTQRPVSRELADQARMLMRSKLQSEGAGKPPRRGPTDLLRRHVYFGVDITTESVVVGPMKFASQPVMPGRVSVPELLNKGGIEVIFGQPVKYAPYPFTPPALEVTERKFRQLIEKTPLV